MILFSRNLKEKNLDCQVQVQQAGMTGFEPAISALTGPHVSRYTTSPFRLAFRNLLLSRSTFSILAYHLCRVKGFAKFKRPDTYRRESLG